MINDLFIHPDFEGGKVNIYFTAPTSRSPEKIDYQVLEGSIVVAHGSLEEIVPGKTIHFEQMIPNFKPWSVEHPNLYRLVIPDLQIDQTFGMFKLHVQDRVLYHNNRPFYMRGFIRGREAHDHPNLTGVSATEYYEKNICIAKAFGFNFVRFHSSVPPIEFLEAADRLGFGCQVEIRKYFGHYQKERQATNFDGDQMLVDEQDWEHMLYKLRNHPCVMVYCMGNEINSPGNNERVKTIRKLTKQLDSSRLFLDTCSRGEYDRDTVDIDVQHMSYFAPFGAHRDMFDDSIHLAIYGSITGKTMIQQNLPEAPTAVTQREVSLKFPLIAHEVSHYNVLRDPWALRDKFAKFQVKEPWWINELIKMIQVKGHESQFKTMLNASTHFQYMWIKQNLESVRKSPILQGFHFLQLSDTDRYENANGLVDCFDDVKDIPPEKIRPFNSNTVLIADLPRRTFWEGEKLNIPIHISHFSTEVFDSGTLTWTLKGKDESVPLLTGELKQIDLARRGNYKIARVEITLPNMDTPKPLVLVLELASEDGKHHVENQWDLWLFPNQTKRIPEMAATVTLKEIRLAQRYPHLSAKTDLLQPEHLLISDHFDETVFHQLEQGHDVLMLYRVEENRDQTAPRERHYLPSTWERFKGIIWDRGHNCGGFLRPHPIVNDFPHTGFIDWQFYHLIEDSDKVDLDDFPVPIEPIIEGVDKAVRDRFDVGRFNLSEFQYDYTMRKFAYLFELKVGQGRLIVAGLNFTGIEKNVPETCWLFESIMIYMQSSAFHPQASLGVQELKTYLAAKGQGKRIKERMMTQYWQLDDAPLESKQYWKNAEAWLRQED